MNAHNPRAVASLDRARFDRLLAAEAEAQAKLSTARENLTAFCRAYSYAHRFGVVLTPDQVRRDLEANG